MLPISPQRLAVYAAVAIAVLVIGWRSQSGSPPTAYPEPAAATAQATDSSATPAVVVVDVVGAVRRRVSTACPAPPACWTRCTRHGPPAAPTWPA
jgi:hypothetical protein